MGDESGLCTLTLLSVNKSSIYLQVLLNLAATYRNVGADWGFHGLKSRGEEMEHNQYRN